VKYLIPVVTTGVLAVCGLLRREDLVAGQEGPPGRNSSEIPRLRRETESATVAVNTSVMGASEASARPLLKDDATMTVMPGPATQEMVLLLRDELGLTEEQQGRVSAFLGEREAELKECHEAIRKSGVFMPREYGRTLARMKVGWYRKIDGILDSRQHLRFEVLVAEGLLRPGTEFGVNLNEMTVLR